VRQRWNGSIQSSNTPTYDKTGLTREDYAMYRCLITDVLYVDDDKNISKNAKNPEVLYEVAILGGWASGQTLSFCRLAPYFGERTLKATSKDISKDRLEEQDGDVVYVQFIQGHDAYPVIIGIAKQFSDATGAKKSDGPRSRDEYNGLETLIDNKGNFTQTMMGGKTDDGVFTAGEDGIVIEEWKAEDEVVTRTYKSGLVVTEDGKNDKVDITTSGGVQTTLDGKSNKITIKAGSSEIDIDGGSGKISIKGEMVELGSSVSDFVTMFTQLASAFGSHFHMAPQAPAGTLPTSPPTAPLLTSVGSQTVKVQP
jgi:hypothetical protein